MTNRSSIKQLVFKMITLSVLVTVTIFGLSEASWPDGRYCLPMPSSQICPSGWQKGVRDHDNEDDQGSSYCSIKRHGWVPYNKKLCRDLGWGFCCKTRDNYPSTGKTWPKGSYCIFRYGGSCPTGFDEGYLRWDDEDTNNANKRHGHLPDGVYGDNTKMHFCCRNDPLVLLAYPHILVFDILTGLPKCSEIIVMRYKGKCPSHTVGYRGPHTGFLQWDTEDNNNGDQRVGEFPDGTKNFINGIKIEFCSYTSSYYC